MINDQKNDTIDSELSSIESSIVKAEKDFSSLMITCFNKVNEETKKSNLENFELTKFEVDKLFCDLSKQFSLIQSKEISRREKLLEKIKNSQIKDLQNFSTLLTNLKELFDNLDKNNDSNDTNNASKAKPHFILLKEMIQAEQKIVLSKNESTSSLIALDNNVFETTIKNYEDTNMSKYFLKCITSNFKLIQTYNNYKDIVDYINGILLISKKICENKADSLHKWSMKLFKEGKFNEALQKMGEAEKSTKDPKGKQLLRFELDKIVLTNMHAKAKYQPINFDLAIQICDRLLNSPYLKSKNREKIMFIRELDLKKKEEMKDKIKKNDKTGIGRIKSTGTEVGKVKEDDKEKEKNNEIHEINIELGEKE